ncbi:MAG: hypothetical protein O7A08_00700 [SAR324 cluster bacterium]|nr:hypothetical protein [SAR324 cluster bacterium]
MTSVVSRFGLLLLAATLFAVGGKAWGQIDGGPTGMVSLRITVQEFDPAAPWNKKPERMVQGNALVVEGGRLLTTANMVKNATLIEVRKFGRYPNYPARAVLVDYELDLAILKVDARGFWEGLKPLPLAGKPIAAGRFGIMRWRANGRFEQGSGEVVELRVATSRFGNLEFPELRGTTAMSSLGKGEVLTFGGKVVGLVTSQSKTSLNATNSPLLRLFITAAQQQPYRGFAQRGFVWQKLDHAALRQYYGLQDNSPGVLIRRVLAGGTGSGQLRKGDILLKLGEHVIDPEGHIFHPLYGPILFSIAINETLDPFIPAEVLRGGQRRILQLERKLFSSADYRVHPYLFDKPIDFEVFGGLILQELSTVYLRMWGKGWRVEAPMRLVIESLLNSLREQGGKPEKVVIISKILPDPVNLGYDDVANTILVKANGKSLTSLNDFRRAALTPPNGFHVLELNPGKGRGWMVFKASEIDAANRRVRQRYGVPQLREKMTARNRAIIAH